MVFAWMLAAASGVLSAQTDNHAAQSSNILINQVHTYNENDLLYLDITAATALPAAVKEALDSGIQLSFITEIEIYSPQRLWPNKKLSRFEIIKKISFHALTKKFIVNDLGTNKTQTFDSIDNALSYLGLYRGIPLTSTALSKSMADAMIRVRIRLLKDKLPWLLYFKSRLPAWRLSSGWYAWHLN